MRIISGIILGLALLGGIISIFIGCSGSRFDGSYAPGATANSLEGIHRTLGSFAIAVIAAIGIAVNAISAIMEKQNELLSGLLIATRKIESPPAKVISKEIPQRNKVYDATDPVGMRPGETPEAWAKRIQDEEAAAFKAKGRA